MRTLGWRGNEGSSRAQGPKWRATLCDGFDRDRHRGGDTLHPYFVGTCSLQTVRTNHLADDQFASQIFHILLAGISTRTLRMPYNNRTSYFAYLLCFLTFSSSPILAFVASFSPAGCRIEKRLPLPGRNGEGHTWFKRRPKTLDPHRQGLGLGNKSTTRGA